MADYVVYIQEKFYSGPEPYQTRLLAIMRDDDDGENYPLFLSFSLPGFIFCGCDDAAPCCTSKNDKSYPYQKITRR